MTLKKWYLSMQILSHAIFSYVLRRSMHMNESNGYSNKTIYFTQFENCIEKGDTFALNIHEVVTDLKCTAHIVHMQFKHPCSLHWKQSDWPKSTVVLHLIWIHNSLFGPHKYYAHHWASAVLRELRVFSRSSL